MRILLVAALALCLACAAPSLSPAAEPNASEYERNFIPLQLAGKEWFANAQGEPSLSGMYERAGHFAANGLAPVCNEQGCGFINTKGQWIIEPKFEEASDFAENGLARVLFEEKTGFINSKGEWAVSPQFVDASDFGHDGLAVAMTDEDNAGYVNAKGEWIIAPRFTAALPFQANGLAVAGLNEKSGLINRKGEWLRQPEYDEILPFAKNELAVVIQEQKYGFLNSKGDVAIPVQYTVNDETFWRFAPGFADNGLAAVEDPGSGKYGYIDASGKWSIAPRFISAIGFDGSLAAAFDGESWGFINEQGEWAIQPRYSWVGNFGVREYAFVFDTQKNTHLIIDRRGQEIATVTMSTFYSFASPDIALVEKEDGYLAYIDLTGKILYEEIPASDEARIIKKGNGQQFWP